MILKSDYIKDSIDTYFNEIKVSSTIIYMVVSITVVISLILLPFIYIDITMSSSGIIRPVTEKTAITSSLTEYVDSVYKTEGSYIHKGDTLLTFSKRSIEKKLHHDKFIIDDYNSQIADLTFLSKGSCPTIFLSPARKNEYQLYLSKKKEIETLVEQTKREHERNTQLYEQKLISRQEYETTMYQYQNKKDELSSLTTNQISVWQTDLTNLKSKLSEYNTDLGQQRIQMEQYVITSPVNGTLEQFTGIYKGNMIQAGTTIATISPSARTYVECYVTPEDIGFVHKGMKVNIQVSAFNYNEWGKITGEVEYVSSDITQDTNGGSYFKVRCKLDKSYLQYKNTGKKGYVKKGMTVSVHFIVARRSLFDCLYQNINNWINPTQNNISE